MPVITLTFDKRVARISRELEIELLSLTVGKL